MAELNNYEEYILSSAGLNAKLPNTTTDEYILDDNNSNIDNDTDLTFADGGTLSTVTSIDGSETFTSANQAVGAVNYFASINTELLAIYTGTSSTSGARTDYESFFDTIVGLNSSIDVWKLQTNLYDAWAYYTGISSNSTNTTLSSTQFADIQALVDSLGALSDLSDGGLDPLTNAALQQSTLNGDFDTLLNEQEFAEQLFQQTFTAFLQTYNWPQSVPGNDYGTAFWAGWLRFVSARTVVDEDAATQFVQGTTHAVDYRALYDAFVPGGNSEDYQERLVAVYREAILRDGYFLPSHHLADFMEEVQKAAAFDSGRISPVAGTGSEKVQVLMRLFRLLVEMIDVLQKVTAAQAERLEFYAAYQKAYTSLIGEIPVMDNAKIGLDSTDRPFKDPADYAIVLNQIQTKTSGWAEQLRAYRSTLGDEAKQHQTAVNQSNEIVNQQAQLGTSLLQQMSTILTTIFK